MLFFMLIFCLGGEAALYVRKRTFHAPMVRFMRQAALFGYVVARGRVVAMDNNKKTVIPFLLKLPLKYTIDTWISLLNSQSG